MGTVIFEDFKKFDFLKKAHPMQAISLFGLEIGEGWYQLVYNLCDAIESYLNRNPELRENFFVAQIKEKFGGLRFYVYGGDEYIQNLIQEAEEVSYFICEVCGKPGKERPTGYIATLCKKHYWDNIWNKPYNRIFRFQLLLNWLLN